MNRVHDAIENLTPTGGASVQTWKQTFTYDRFGNRSFDEANTTADAISFPKSCGTTPNFTMCAADKKIFNPSINSNDDNRLDTSEGYRFDNSGNTTRDAQSRKFSYDAENKQIKVETVDSNGNVTGTIGEYFYDGDGKRVKKYVPATGETTIFIYDASGKLVEEYSTIVETTDPKVSYLTNDHLGSPRITTDRDGQTISRRDFQPFGEEIATNQRTQGLGYTDDSVRQKFTGYERDDETDLDFAQARMYKKEFGRFTSPDPLLTSATISNSQTWNRYTYSLNNPLRFTDPTGMFIWSNDLGGDREDADLEAYYTGEANKIKNKKKREKALRKVSGKVQKIIAKRKEIRDAIDRAKESLNNLSGKEKEDVERAINSYGEEGKTNKNVVLGQWGEKGKNENGKTLFGENGMIFVMLGNVSGDGLANQFAHEGSHVADFQDFNDGVAGSNITISESERRAWSVSAYVAKSLGNDTFPASLPGNLRVWNKGWTPDMIAVGVSNRIAGPPYNNNQKLISVEKSENIRDIRAAFPDWY